MRDITADAEGRSRLRVILAASVGSALEWYDFFLYGTVAALVFPRLFFPEFDPFVGRILSFSTFTVGFVARPLGAAGSPLLRSKSSKKRAVGAESSVPAEKPMIPIFAGS